MQISAINFDIQQQRAWTVKNNRVSLHLQVSNNFDFQLGQNWATVICSQFRPQVDYKPFSTISYLCIGMKSGRSNDLRTGSFFYSGVKERKPPNLPEWMLCVLCCIHTTVSAILVFRIHSNLLKWIFLAFNRAQPKRKDKNWHCFHIVVMSCTMNREGERWLLWLSKYHCKWIILCFSLK